jgi:hypothetical protein
MYAMQGLETRKRFIGTQQELATRTIMTPYLGRAKI